MLITIKIILAATIIFAALFLLVLVRHPRSFTILAFMTQIASTLGWTLGIFLNLWLTNPFIEQLVFFFATLGITAQLWFAKLWQTDILPSKVSAYGTLFVGLFFALASFYPGALFTSLEVTPQGYTILGNGFLSTSFSLFAVSYVAYTIYLLAQKHRATRTKTEREQTRLLFWGFSLFFLINLFTNALLPIFFGVYFFNAIGPAFALILIGFIMYTIARHQFLNIKVAIIRGVIYSILLALVVSTYLAIVFFLGDFLEHFGSINILLGAGITTLVGIVGVPPLERYFQKTTDRIFFKDIYDYAETLSELSDILNKNVDLDAIVKETSAYLARNLRVSYVHFDFFQDQETHDGDTIIPITIGKRTTGQLIVGEKLSGDPLSLTDHKLLHTFANQAAITLEKAYLFDQVREYSEHLEQKISERTAQITALQRDQERMMLDISHGLQTPLTVMKGELELLKRQGYANNKAESLDRSIDRISTFVQQLLSLAHLETTGRPSYKERFDLSDLVRDLALDFTPLAQKKRDHSHLLCYAAHRTSWRERQD